MTTSPPSQFSPPLLDHFDERRYLIPFRSLLLPHIFTDTLIIGSGVAGMRAAIEAAPHGDVTMLLKGPAEQCSTWLAQGGIAAAVDDDDQPAMHEDDTLRTGAGLCNADAVRVLVEEAAGAIDELLAWDMRFDRDANGGLALGREGGHGRNRILHTDGAATGRELWRCLMARVRSFESIRVFDHCFALDLLTTGRPGDAVGSDSQRVLGALTHHPKYGLQIIWAKATILATGGAGQVYRETTNAKGTTGDGLAMAWRAGAVAGDLEFVQFHPTTLYVAGASRVLISEAVRGEGAHILDRDGVRFMPDYHPDAELAPRDTVSRAIIDRLLRTQEPRVFLDVRHIEGFATRFPTLTRELAAFDLDPSRDLIPVHPSAHYALGGVWTDLDGRSSLPGLLAVGEAACTGLHGANRLASNSLLEGLVFGARAGRAAVALSGYTTGPMKIVSDVRANEHADLDLIDVGSSLRSAMWRNVGIERDGRKLADVQDMFSFWGRYTMDAIFDDLLGWEIQNLLTVGALTTRAALRRTETRGVHCRLDHTELDPALAVHAQWQRGRREPTLWPATAATEDTACPTGTPAAAS